MQGLCFGKRRNLQWLPNSNRIFESYILFEIFFEFPRGDFFFHFFGVGDVVYNLVNDCLFLLLCNFNRWNSSEKSSQFISLMLVKVCGANTGMSRLTAYAFSTWWKWRVSTKSRYLANMLSKFAFAATSELMTRDVPVMIFGTKS